METENFNLKKTKWLIQVDPKFDDIVNKFIEKNGYTKSELVREAVRQYIRRFIHEPLTED